VHMALAWIIDIFTWIV